jgi:hypothetical protein
MKEITEKQIVAIKRMARASKTEVSNIEEMSRFEASKLITALGEKLDAMKGKTPTASPSSGGGQKRDFSSEALAGLAVKIVAQKCKVSDVLQKEEGFKKTVAELYRVFSLARQGCLAF